MGRILSLVAFLVVVLFLSLGSFSIRAARAADVDNLIAREMVHEGVKRKYFIHAPASYDPGRPVPLVMVFHDRDQDAAEISEITGFNTISDGGAFIVVYPEAVKGVWNDGRKGSWAHLYDDIGFVEKLVDRLEIKWNIDTKRVYACGLGDGGFFCQSLAVNRPNKITAVASVSATLPEIVYHKRKPLAPVSVLFVVGMKDPIVPYEGGAIDPGKLKHGLGRVVSASQAVDFWVKANKCAGRYEQGLLPDLDPTDSTRVRWVQYRDCAGQSEVVLMAVEEGGHGWPGSKKELSSRKFGSTCKEFDGAQEIWRFFSRRKLANSR